MKKIFNENDYNFTDSILDGVKLDDKNINDCLVSIDYFLGKKGSMPLMLRLKNVSELDVHISKKIETQLISVNTLSHISKERKEKYFEIKIFSAMTFFDKHENDEPLIRCLCEEMYIEDKITE